MAKWLLVSDLHLQDTTHTEYRWRLFEQLIAIINRHHVDRLFILGDLTEHSNFHSSSLVNRVVDNLCKLYKSTRLIHIEILKGNHDGIDGGLPYFYFLNQLPYIKFHDKPCVAEINKKRVALLPHTKKPYAEWAFIEFDDLHAVFMHATFAGAGAESGIKMKGLTKNAIGNTKAPVFSGDIHVPQVINGVEYVGAPYPIRFGDAYQPRVLLLDTTDRKWPQPKQINLDNIRKLVAYISTPEDLKAVKAKPGDQIKLRLVVGEHTHADNIELERLVRRWMRKNPEVTVYSVEHVAKQKRKIIARKLRAATSYSVIDTIDAYGREKKIPTDILKVGKGILRDAVGHNPTYHVNPSYFKSNPR